MKGKVMMSAYKARKSGARPTVAMVRTLREQIDILQNELQGFNVKVHAEVERRMVPVQTIADELRVEVGLLKAENKQLRAGMKPTEDVPLQVPPSVIAAEALSREAEAKAFNAANRRWRRDPRTGDTFVSAAMDEDDANRVAAPPGEDGDQFTEPDNPVKAETRTMVRHCLSVLARLVSLLEDSGA
jgi:hypothetical protein